MDASTHGFFRGGQFLILGCGYVGTAVARALRAAGAGVTALVHSHARVPLLESLGVRCVVGDIASADWHSCVPPHPDGVLMSVSSGGGGPAGYWSSYVEGMRSVAEWARLWGPPGSLIYTSSTSLYDQGGGIEVDESAHVGAEVDTVKALLAAEQVVPTIAVRQARTIFRLAGIYGPERHHLLDQLRTGAEALPGNPDAHLNLIHRDDILSALVAAFAWMGQGAAERGGAVGAGADDNTAAPPTRVLNLADGSPGTRAEVAAWICARLGRKPPEFTGAITPGRSRLVPDRRIVARRVREVLGWAPAFPSFREGLDPIIGA